MPENQQKIGSQKNLSLGSISLLNPSKARISPGLLTWFLLAVVIIFEIFILYKYIYLNLLIQAVSPEPTAIVKINFDNYNKVTKRLDEVSVFQPSGSINFFSAQGSGRDNPFTNP